MSILSEISLTSIDWFKHYDYEILHQDNSQYIKPSNSNLVLNYNILSPDKAGVLLNALHIGKMCFFKENDISKEILLFTKNYGPIGFINSFIYNHNYFSSNYVVMRKNPITNELTLSFSEYIKNFFPTINDELPSNDINNSFMKKVIKGDQKHLLFCTSQEFYLLTSKVYSEKIEWIANYFEQLYAFVYASYLNKKCLLEKTSILDINIYQPFDLYQMCQYKNIDPIEYYISSSLTTEITAQSSIIFKPHSLKSIIDFLLSIYSLHEKTPLRICKHCKTAFVGENIRTEFCSPKCRNQYNVYKTRSRKGLNE